MVSASATPLTSPVRGSSPGVPLIMDMISSPQVGGGRRDMSNLRRRDNGAQIHNRVSRAGMNQSTGGQDSEPIHARSKRSMASSPGIRSIDSLVTPVRDSGRASSTQNRSIYEMADRDHLVSQSFT
jgi:hypothetical protein